MMTSLRTFRIFLAFFAAVMVVTGVVDIVFGPAALPGSEPVDPTVDSHFRFFAAIWVGMGVLLFATLPRVLTSELVIRVIAGAVFLGGLARLLSLAMSGTPHPMMLGLLAVELVVPPVLIVWHNWLVAEPEGADQLSTVGGPGSRT